MFRLFVVLMLFSGPSLAQECKQGNAIYKDGGGFTLSFEAKNFATTPYILRLENKRSGDSLIGDIIYGNGVAVPFVRFAKNCDLSDYGLECSDEIYEGIAYSILEYEVSDLPLATEPAARAILLPQSIHDFYNAYKDGVLKEVPTELFRLSGCQ